MTIRILARLRAASPKLAATGVALGICGWGAALVWPGSKQGGLAPSIDATPTLESTAALGEWTLLPRAAPLFALDAPDFPAGARLHEARRRSVGAAREDLLAYNAFSRDALHLALRFESGGEPSGASFFVALARQAAREGLVVERMTAAADMDSKFGVAEAADVLLATGSDARACLAFRVTIVPDALEASGYACGPQARPVERAQLGCLIDRIALLASGDGAVRQAFAAAELRRRSACAAPRLLQTGRRSTWLDPAGQQPTLNGTLAMKGG